MGPSGAGVRAPAQILGDSDVNALRHWAFSALAAGRGAAVVDVIGQLHRDGPSAPTWEDTRRELQVRAGIALDRPELVATAAFHLLREGAEGDDPQVLLPLAVGAQWLVEDAMTHVAPSVRFKQSRTMLSAARWALARALSSGDLGPSALAEGAAALDRLYATAWRERDPVASLTSPGDVPPAFAALQRTLREAGDAEPEDRIAVAGDVLWQLAERCEPAWPVLGGPWWTSDTYGLTIDVSAPVTAADRHRFAMADVFLEIDDVEAIRAGVGFDEEAAEPLAAHVHELADQAVAHAIGAGFPSRRARGGRR